MKGAVDWWAGRRVGLMTAGVYSSVSFEKRYEWERQNPFSVYVCFRGH